MALGSLHDDQSLRLIIPKTDEFLELGEKCQTMMSKITVIGLDKGNQRGRR